MPQIGNTTPSLDAFAEAQDRKRRFIGSDIVFLWDPVVTFPAGTPLNPMSGQPYDPTVTGSAAAQPSATVRCSAFFKAINRGGASNSEIASPIGHDEKTRLFLNCASADGLIVKGEAGPGAGSPATEFLFHGNRFKIYSIKDDEIVLGYLRTLVYGAGIGSDADSGFRP